MAKYTEQDHKRAWELYKTLGSFQSVAREEGMPTASTLLRWASAKFKCPFDCKWHGWDDLDQYIRTKVRERLRDSGIGEDQTDQTDRIDRTKSNADRTESNGLERYIQTDLNRLKVNRALETTILKKLQEGGLVAPDTITEAQTVLAKIWSQDRLILGEPTSRVELTMSPREWREYILALAEQEQAKHETPEDNQ